MENERDEDYDVEPIHPIFGILRKVMGFKHEKKLEEIIESKKDRISNIHWILKPLEEIGYGIMHYRVIANIDGKSIRVEKDNEREPSSFTKREAEYFISKMMDRYPEIEQDVNLKKIHNVDTSKFERISTKKFKR